MRSSIILSCLFLFCTNAIHGQSVSYAQELIDTLTTEYFFGRGYVNSGDRRAAEFLASEFEKLGVNKFKGERYHSFSFPVNTFPGAMQVVIDGTELKTGLDYIVEASSAGIDKTGIKIKHLSEAALLDDKLFKKALRKRHDGYAVMVDTVSDNEVARERRKTFIENFKGHCLLRVETDLTWSVSRYQSNRVTILIKPGWESAQTLDLHIESEFIPQHEAKNVLGVIPGTEVPDSFIIFTGHYDHLGGMGQSTFIPGANDNASGIAMMMDMANYFKKNPPRYSLVFIAFAGEEAGLVGSYYFVNELNNFFSDIKSIKFLLNMDLMGSGEDGIMAVNGKVYQEQFALLDSINRENLYLKEVRSRGKAANSDHYFFTEAGIPGFFVYLMGDYAYYHEVYDSSENLRLNRDSYTGAFELLRSFLQCLMYQ